MYSSLDFLGDIGGLYGTFNGFASTFTLLLNFNGVYHLLTSKLFKAETRVAGSNTDAKTDAEGRRKSVIGSLFAK